MSGVKKRTRSNSAGSPQAKSRSVADGAVIRVGGVPEHFNHPWHMAQDRGLFAKHGVQVEWVEIKLGTGAMLQALKKGEVDLIVALTEGLVADIAQGSNVCMISSYVHSPLCWAASVGQESKYHSVEDLQGETFAVSRMGSGSHLMAYVLASQRGWDLKTLRFEVRGSFEQLRAAVNNKDDPSAVFLWETFTTKPFHDSKEIRRVGEVVSPWPCFLIASTRPYVEANRTRIAKCLLALKEACVMFAAEQMTMPAQIAQKYGILEPDARAWMQGVKILAEDSIPETAIEKAVEVLTQVGVIPASVEPLPLTAYVDAGLCRLEGRSIKNMKLYDKPTLVKFIYNELKAAGLSHGPLSYKDLLPFDIHHYHGTQSLDECTEHIIPHLSKKYFTDEITLAHVLKVIFPNKPPEKHTKWLQELGKCDIELVGDLRMLTDDIWVALDLSPVLKSGLTSIRHSVLSDHTTARVINVGSGLGGCARYLAAKYCWEVLAVELQDDLHAIAKELTERCEEDLQSKVFHLGGDFMRVGQHLGPNSYDAIVSWLTVLHIQERIQFLELCLKLLKPGGIFYADDFCKLHDFTQEEEKFLGNEVYVQTCPTIPEYKRHLQQAGFHVLEVIDLTASWTQFTARRATEFNQNAARHEAVHGKEVYSRLSSFYDSIAALFASGHVGGIRIVAMKLR